MKVSRDEVVDELLRLMGPVLHLLRVENGVLGPVKKVYKVPEPARTPAPAPTPIRVPEEAPKEPEKVA